MKWFEGWWARHMMRPDTVETIVRYRHGDLPGIYWHRVGPREHVVLIARVSECADAD